MNHRDDGMLDAVFREPSERTTSLCQNECMVVSSFGEIARVRSYVVGHDAGWKGRSPEGIGSDLRTHNKPGSPDIDDLRPVPMPIAC